MLMNWDPFGEVDRLFAGFRGGSTPTGSMDVYRDDDRYVVHFDLPGLDPASIDVQVDHNMLTVAALRPRPADQGQEVIVERPYGEFRRQLSLGDGLDLDHLEASYRDGVLTLTIPLAEKAKPRKVEITGSSEPKAIGTGSSAA